MKCAGCIYRKKLSGGEASTACHYMHDTGKLRGCSAKECYTKKVHYTPKRAAKVLRRKEATTRNATKIVLTANTPIA